MKIATGSIKLSFLYGFSGCLISVMLSYLTYTYIEKPVRMIKDEFASKVAFTLFLLLLLLGGIGKFINIFNGLVDRKANNLKELNRGEIDNESFAKYQHSFYYLCTSEFIYKGAYSTDVGLKKCFQSKEKSPIDIAIIGDSHADHLFIGLAENFSNKNIVVYNRSALPTVFSKEFEDINNYIINEENIKAVIISASWIRKSDDFPSTETFYSALFKTCEFFTKANKKVFLIDDIPSFSFDTQKCKYERVFNTGNICSEPREELEKKILSIILI